MREDMNYAGWKSRRENATRQALWAKQYDEQEARKMLERVRQENPSAIVEEDVDWGDVPVAMDPASIFDPATQQHTGAILGIGLSSVKRQEQKNPETGKLETHDQLTLIPGDDIQLTFPKAGTSLNMQTAGFATASFTVVDLYESGMTDYDQQFIFVPIDKLQQLRGMFDPGTGKGMVSRILIKAKPGVDINALRDQIQKHFRPELYHVVTWQDLQAPILNAVYNELAMLNVLLFLIFAVAGFGILAIFYTIVLEKKKDIGIMKSLGASGRGVMQIFVYYSLLLGMVGSLLGLGLGFLMVAYINEIAHGLSFILNSDVFNPDIYFFYEIPTIVQPMTVFKIISGALLIAVASGVLPAVLASRMQPVESLRS